MKAFGLMILFFGGLVINYFSILYQSAYLLHCFFRFHDIHIILPLSVVKRTHVTLLQPSGKAVSVKSVPASPPSKNALFIKLFILLAVNTQVHDVVAADSAGFH